MECIKPNNNEYNQGKRNNKYLKYYNVQIVL